MKIGQNLLKNNEIGGVPNEEIHNNIIHILITNN